MKKNYKVGDRIFLEYWNNKEVFDCIVTKVEPRTYEYNSEVINFNMLHTGPHTMTEDYNCLDEDDPRVIEYKKTHEDPRIFIQKFEAFMKENNYSMDSLKNGTIQEYLYNLTQG